MQTKPRSEARALENLERQQFECLLPRIRRAVSRARQRGQVVGIEPLFPRDLFLRADAERQSRALIRSMLGVIDLTRFAGLPARVPDEIIAQLRQDSGPDCIINLPSSTLHLGDTVQIVDGPFVGLSGLYSQESGEQRAIILLLLLGGERAVTRPLDAVLPAAIGFL